jgi:predicted nucleotidyltransferase
MVFEVDRKSRQLLGLVLYTGFYLFLAQYFDIIHVRKIFKINLYLQNRKMALNKIEKAMLDQFKDKLKQILGDQFVELMLFGSKARGDDRPDSDIDVLVIVTTDDWRIRDKVYEIATDILLQADVCISPKVLSKNKFNQISKEGTSFIHNVSKDAITI